MKRILQAGIILVLTFCFMNGVECQAKTFWGGGTYKGFHYDYIDDGSTIYLRKYVGKKTVVKTPKKIKGKKVVELGSAFWGNHKIKKLTISEGIEEIENGAFYDMQSLRWISFPQSLKKLQKDTYLNYYSEASDFPKITYVVVKGSKAFQTVTKRFSSSKIVAKSPKKLVTWFDTKDYITKTHGDRARRIAAGYYKKGSKYKKLPKVSRKGYRFLGWYTKKKGGKKVTAKTKVKKSQTLYAHWKFLSYRAMLHEPYYDKEEGEPVYSRIYFGKYPKKSSSSTEKIRWRILKLNGNKAFVISEELLDAQAYTERVYEGDFKYGVSPESTWATSNIRSWLNGYGRDQNATGYDYSSGTRYHWSAFINSAFSAKERGIIQTTTIKNGGASGADTQDKIFLLSLEEYNNASFYLKKDDASQTEYARKFAEINGNYDEEWWWLRTMQDSRHAYTSEGKAVPTFGSGGTVGVVTQRDEFLPYIRPAMWIDLSNESLWQYD